MHKCMHTDVYIMSLRSIISVNRESYVGTSHKFPSILNEHIVVGEQPLPPFLTNLLFYFSPRKVLKGARGQTLQECAIIWS